MRRTYAIGRDLAPGEQATLATPPIEKPFTPSRFALDVYPAEPVLVSEVTGAPARAGEVLRVVVENRGLRRIRVSASLVGEEG